MNEKLIYRVIIIVYIIILSLFVTSRFIKIHTNSREYEAPFEITMPTYIKNTINKATLKFSGLLIEVREKVTVVNSTIKIINSTLVISSGIGFDLLNRSLLILNNCRILIVRGCTDVAFQVRSFCGFILEDCNIHIMDYEYIPYHSEICGYVHTNHRRLLINATKASVLHILNCTIDTDDGLISMYRCSNILISASEILDASFIIESSSGVRIYGSTFRGWGVTFLRILDSTNISIINNMLTNVILVLECDKSLMCDVEFKNTSINNREILFIQDKSNININATKPLILFHCSNITISGSDLCYIGIFSSQNIFLQNVISEELIYIVVTNSTYVRFSECRFKTSLYGGALMNISHSKTIRIYATEIINDDGIGIKIASSRDIIMAGSYLKCRICSSIDRSLDIRINDNDINSIKYFGVTGIVVKNSINTLICDNIIVGFPENSILIENVSQLQIYTNQISGGNIMLKNIPIDSNITILNNTLNNYTIMFYKDASYLSIDNKTYAQVILFNCSDICLTDLTTKSILIINCRGIELDNIYVKDSQFGLHVECSSNILINAYECVDSKYALLVRLSMDLSIYQCKLDGEYYSLIIENSSNVDISNCRIMASNYGVSIFYSSNVSINHCEAYSIFKVIENKNIFLGYNTFYGRLVLRKSSNISLVGNKILSTLELDLECLGDLKIQGNTGCSGNMILVLVGQENISIREASFDEIVMINCSNIVVSKASIKTIVMLHCRNVILSQIASTYSNHGIHMINCSNICMNDLNILATTYCITIIGSSKVSISDSIIKGYGYGVYVLSSSHIALVHSNISVFGNTDSLGYGTIICRSTNISIINCEINSEICLYAVTNRDISIHNCEIYSNSIFPSYSFMLSSAINITITHNNIMFHKQGRFSIYEIANARILNNSIMVHCNHINFRGLINAIIKNNIMQTLGYSINIEDCTKILLHGNNITNEIGLYIANTQQIYLYFNKIIITRTYSTGDIDAIYIYKSRHVWLIGNKIGARDIGIYIKKSEHITIERNIIESRMPILPKESEDLTVRENDMMDLGARDFIVASIVVAGFANLILLIYAYIYKKVEIGMNGQNKQYIA